MSTEAKPLRKKKKNLPLQLKFQFDFLALSSIDFNNRINSASTIPREQTRRGQIEIPIKSYVLALILLLAQSQREKRADKEKKEKNYATFGGLKKS